MRKKIVFILITLSVAMNIAFLSFSGARFIQIRREAGKSCDRPEVECPLHRHLGTNSEQWRRIEPVVTAFREKAQAVCQNVARARMELFDLLAAPEPDKQKITAKQEEILAGQRQVQELVIDHILEQKEILTPDQSRELFHLLRKRSDCVGHGSMPGMPRKSTGNSGTCSGMGPGRRQCP